MVKLLKILKSLFCCIAAVMAFIFVFAIISADSLPGISLLLAMLVPLGVGCFCIKMYEELDFEIERREKGASK